MIDGFVKRRKEPSPYMGLLFFRKRIYIDSMAKIRPKPIRCKDCDSTDPLPNGYCPKCNDRRARKYDQA